MQRYLEGHIRQDLEKKIVLLSGPRQVGKTTLSKQIWDSFVYLSYDSGPDREMLRKMEWDRNAKLVIFDELHKMKNWKSWIKGVYDTRGIPPGILVTGSSRLDLVRKGGDSLAGRFFSYRLHPLTVHEICVFLPETPAEALENLLKLGASQSLILRRMKTWPDGGASAIWTRSSGRICLDLEKIRDLKSIEILVDLLKSRVGSPVSHNALAGDLQVSPHTVKHWLELLEGLCVIFAVRPYHRNIARSILKEPKYYFYDIGAVEGGQGAKLENAVAAALLRELHFLEDTTGRKGHLHYLRDKEKNEVDFLVVLENRPCLMVEVKTDDDHFSKSIFHFQKRLPGVRSVQAVYQLERRKSSGDADMIGVDDFLRHLSFEKKK